VSLCIDGRTDDREMIQADLSRSAPLPSLMSTWVRFRSGNRKRTDDRSRARAISIRFGLEERVKDLPVLSDSEEAPQTVEPMLTSDLAKALNAMVEQKDLLDRSDEPGSPLEIAFM
jgi:hypothetical protein